MIIRRTEAQTAVDTTSKKNWKRHVKLAFRKRWVQLVIVLFIALLVMLVSFFLLKPKSVPKGDTSQFKFIRCDVCKLEMPYQAETANKRCPKCQPPNTGFMLPAVDS